jgi:6-phosphogluconate dehydrogenase (decarboxylating)
MRSATIARAALALVPLCLGLGGCAAVAAGAGAAAAIAYSERGVSSKVEGSPAQVFQRSQAVFRDLGITETGHEMGDTGSEHELKGRRGDLEVTVDMHRENDTLTSVDVYAQKSAVEFDRDYARQVLEAIIARS